MPSEGLGSADRSTERISRGSGDPPSAREVPRASSSKETALWPEGPAQAQVRGLEGQVRGGVGRGGPWRAIGSRASRPRAGCWDIRRGLVRQECVGPVVQTQPGGGRGARSGVGVFGLQGLTWQTAALRARGHPEAGPHSPGGADSALAFLSGNPAPCMSVSVGLLENDEISHFPCL